MQELHHGSSGGQERQDFFTPVEKNIEKDYEIVFYNSREQFLNYTL